MFAQAQAPDHEMTSRDLLLTMVSALRTLRQQQRPMRRRCGEAVAALFAQFGHMTGRAVPALWSCFYGHTSLVITAVCLKGHKTYA